MNATSVKVTTSVLSVAATLAVAGRFWARKIKKQRYGLDDWTVLSSWVVMWGLAAVILVGTEKGLYNNHTLHTNIENIGMTDTERLISKYNFVKCLLLIAGLGLVKLSVVFLYRRIFDVVRIFHIYSICLIILLAVWTIAFFFANVFQCGTHFSALWGNPAVMLRYCQVSAPASYGFVVSDIITDIMVLVSPIPIIWNMRTSTDTKFGITAIFGLGLFSTAAACGRLYTFLQALRKEKSPWQMESELAIWAVIEVSVAVIAACLPVMRPIIQLSCFRHVGALIGSGWSQHEVRKDNPSWVEIREV